MSIWRRRRGVPVTREQAFDIIRRTDRFFYFYVSAVCNHKDYIGCMNFDNWLIQKNHYLDLIIAVTWWNEGPWGDETVSEEEFCKEVAVGIYVHDRKLEILNPSDTIAKYKEYNKHYGTPPEKFEPEYYERHKIKQVNPAYLRKCIEAYGLDADKMLKRR